MLAYINRKYLTSKCQASVSLYIIYAVCCSFRKVSRLAQCTELVRHWTRQNLQREIQQQFDSIVHVFDRLWWVSCQKENIFKNWWEAIFIHFIWKLTPASAEFFSRQAKCCQCNSLSEVRCMSVWLYSFIVCGFDSKNVLVFLAKIGNCTESAKFYFQNKQLQVCCNVTEWWNSDRPLSTHHAIRLCSNANMLICPYMLIFADVLNCWKQVFLKLGVI